MTALALKIDDEVYRLPNGEELQRETASLTPNGNKMNGRWVLRNKEGDLIDFDQYRNDLAERNNFEIRTEKG